MPSISYFNPLQGLTVSPAATAVAVNTADKSQASSAAQTFAYSTFNHEKDNVPTAGQRTWHDFAKAMQYHKARKTKEGTKLFSPVAYKPGAKRGNAGVVEITMAVFDVDAGVSPETVKAKLAGLAYIMHSTWSHTPESPSYRVIVPFTAPVQSADWPQIWARLNLFLDWINDPSVKDPARAYYLPSHPEGRTDYFAEVGEGNFLDPNSLPELPPTVQAQIKSTAVSTISNGQIEGLEELTKDLNPEAGLREVCNRCVFMQHVSQPDNQNSVSEPLWKAMISNAACFENAEEWIHQSSCHHDGYSEAETNKAIIRFMNGNFGPMTCSRIQQQGFAGCPDGGCKLPSGGVTKAPAGLWAWILKKSPAVLTTVAAASKPDHVSSFLDKHYPSGLYYCNESFYGYDAGAWVVQDERSDIRRKIAEMMGEIATGKKVNDTLTLLKDFQSVREADINQNRHLICLANGTLDTNTYELLEHNPSHGLKTKSSIEWNPDATCPRWLQFLDEIFVNDIDKDQKIAFVQEFIGYCLVPDCSQHKFLWMIGGGGNGKGTIIKIMVVLVGKANVSNAQLERLDSAFVRAELEDKLVNFSSEIAANATISDSYLKAVVGGDMIEAERKYKPSFSFTPFVRLVAATNTLPRLLDLSDGFARRAIILSFNRKFDDSNKDIELDNKLSKELSGILTWAVNGLQRLRERGRFEIPQSSAAALSKYRKDSDPVQIFVEECLEPIEGRGLAPAEVYFHYRNWSLQGGFSPMNKVRFGQRLAEILGEDGKHRSGGKDYWMVRIKSDDDSNLYQVIGLPSTSAPMAGHQFRM